MPYQRRDDFLTPAEQSFYQVLSQAVTGWAIVCPKVSLGDLFYAKTGNRSENQAYTNRISRKHVDFLLCDKQTLSPLLGIELDDKSHQRSDRRRRDKFVEQVFTTAKLPLARVPVQYSYNTNELAQNLRSQAGLGTEKSTGLIETEITTSNNNNAVPNCPKCGRAMIRRIAKKGPNQGNEFWGCSGYPNCRGIIAIPA